MDVVDVVDVDAILADARLARVAPALRALVRPAIRLRARADTDGGAVGASRLGGRPDLPPGRPWPTARLRVPPPSPGFARDHPHLPVLPAGGEIALPFIAQFRLAEVAPHDAEGLLPPTGLLSSFYNPVAFYSDTGAAPPIRDGRTGSAYGIYDFGTPANWRVLHDPGAPADLAAAAPPPGLPLPAAYDARALRFAREATLPTVETFAIGEPGGAGGGLALTDEEWADYAELRQEGRGEARVHLLLGHEDSPQPYAMAGGYAAARDALFPGPRPFAALDAGARRAEVAGGRLLLQVDEEDNGMRFGRGGRLFFFIMARDLAAGRFDRVWTTEQ